MYIGSILFAPAGLGIPAYVQSALNGIWVKYKGADTDGQLLETTNETAIQPAAAEPTTESA